MLSIIKARIDQLENESDELKHAPFATYNKHAIEIEKKIQENEIRLDELYNVLSEYAGGAIK